jgi:hypothetical protein
MFNMADNLSQSPQQAMFNMADNLSPDAFFIAADDWTRKDVLVTVWVPYA